MIYGLISILLINESALNQFYIHICKILSSKFDYIQQNLQQIIKKSLLFTQGNRFKTDKINQKDQQGRAFKQIKKISIHNNSILCYFLRGNQILFKDLSMKNHNFEQRKISFASQPLQNISIFQKLQVKRNASLQTKMAQLTLFQIKSLQFLSGIWNQQKQTNRFLDKMIKKDGTNLIQAHQNSQNARQTDSLINTSRQKTLRNKQDFFQLNHQFPKIIDTHIDRDYIGFKVQSSKQKLASDRNQLMNGLQKVLSNLKGQKKVRFKTQEMTGSLESSIESPNFKNFAKSKQNNNQQKNFGTLKSNQQSQQVQKKLFYTENVINQEASQQQSKNLNQINKLHSNIKYQKSQKSQKSNEQARPQIIIHTVNSNSKGKIKGLNSPNQLQQDHLNCNNYAGLRKPPKMKTFIKSNVDSNERDNQDNDKKSQQCSKEMQTIRKQMRKSGRRVSAYQFIQLNQQQSISDQSQIMLTSPPKKQIRNLFAENQNIDLYIQDSYQIMQSGRLQDRKKSNLFFSKGQTTPNYRNFDVYNLKIEKSHIYGDQVQSQNFGAVTEQDVEQSMVKINYFNDNIQGSQPQKINQNCNQRRPSIDKRHELQGDIFGNFDYDYADAVNQQIKHVQSLNAIPSSSNNQTQQLKFAQFNEEFPLNSHKHPKSPHKKRRRMSLANNMQLKEEQKRIQLQDSNQLGNLLNLPMLKIQSKTFLSSPKDNSKSSMMSSQSRQNHFQVSKLNIPLNISTNMQLQTQKIPFPQLDTLIKGQIQLGNKLHLQTFNNIKNYSRLGDIQEIADKRQLKIKISFYQMCKSGNIKQFHGKKQLQSFVSEWLGIVYRSTASVSWNMLQNRKLDYDQTKVLFTQNIIFNFIQLMKDIRNLGLHQYIEFIPEAVNKKSVQVINFLCKQYPQTKIDAPNLALKSEIPHIDEKGKIQYEFVRKSNVCFRVKKSRHYASEIMQFINYLIDVTNNQYSQFQEFTNNLFSRLYIPQNERGSNLCNSKQLNKNIEKHISYQQKVRKYTKFLIGRKIPKNTCKYSQQEIQNGVFFVKSSQILRVLSKWVEQLTQIVKKPQQLIKDWFYPFKDHNGDEQYAQYPIRKGIYSQIIKSRQQLLVRMQNIRKQCYQIQGQLSGDRHINIPDQKFLNQEQINIGLFASNIKNAMSSYLCKQLNEVIHFLLTVPLKVDEKRLGVAEYFEQKTKKQLQTINLITFRVFDLLRCKCTSSESQIIWLVNQIKQLDRQSHTAKTSQKSLPQQQDFKIVRFKDRLNLSSRDILINAKIGNSPVFQIQLSVNNTVGEKQELMDKYNHFLYELRRATMLGSIVQNISIWTSLQQKSLYFENLVEKNILKVQVIAFQHKCPGNKSFKQIMQPIICSSCSAFYHIPRTCLLNMVCKGCRLTVCGQCYYLGLSSEQRKAMLFDKRLNKQFLGMLKQIKPINNLSFSTKSIDKDSAFLSKNIFFIKKDSLKPQLNYMTTHNINESSSLNIGTQNDQLKAVQTTISKSGRVVNRSLFSNISEMKLKMQSLIMFQFNPHGRRQYLTVEQIRRIDLSQSNKIRLIDLMSEANYISSTKQYITTKEKQRYLLNLQTILGTKRKIQTVKIKRSIILLQPLLDYKELERQIMCRQNILRLEAFARNNSSVVSIEKRNMTVEMDILQEDIGVQLYTNLCRHLTKIYLNYGKIKSIDSLRPLDQIDSLYVSNNQIESLAGLQNMKRLKVINFDRNKVDSLEPLSKLVQLEYIAGNQNKIQSLKYIEKLVKVKEISLHGNAIRQIQGFTNSSQLQVLFLTNNQIQNIKNLQSLKKIEKLTLSLNKIQTIENLTPLKTLQDLSLCQLNLRVVPDQISTLFSLQILDLSENSIKKIQKLDRLKGLKVLKLRKNLIKRIQGLQNQKLTHLNLDDNEITELTGISGFLDTIESLSIRRCPIQNCGDLKDIQLNFKILWTKSSFKPKARFELETIFKQDYQDTSIERSSLMRSSTLKSSKNLSESRDLRLKYF